MKMPFGKYSKIHYPPDGVSLEFINSGYLKWLMNQDFMLERKDETLLLAVEKELKFREENNCHFWKDKVKEGI
jgi:uncharacterized protein (DUF3820 family)